MSLSEPTSHRLDTLERSISVMSDRVGEVAKYMERLIVLEERNTYMADQLLSVKTDFKSAISDLKAQNTKIEADLKAQTDKLEAQINDLNNKMVKVLTIFSIGSSALAFLAPHLLKVLTAGGG